jgi:hypothetical protein
MLHFLAYLLFKPQFSFSDLLKTSPMLMVGTTAGMLEFNARTLDMAGYVDFQGIAFYYYKINLHGQKLLLPGFLDVTYMSINIFSS